jgi:hypothetical protein
MRKYDASVLNIICVSSNEVGSIKKTSVMLEEMKSGGSEHSCNQPIIAGNLPENIKLTSEIDDLTDEYTLIAPPQLAIQGMRLTSNHYVDGMDNITFNLSDYNNAKQGNKAGCYYCR